MMPSLQNSQIVSVERVEPAGLTTRQARVLTLVTDYYRVTEEPCPASYIARKMRRHHSTIGQHLAALHRKGWLRAPNAPAVPKQRR